MADEEESDEEEEPEPVKPPITAFDIGKSYLDDWSSPMDEVLEGHVRENLKRWAYEWQRNFSKAKCIYRMEAEHRTAEWVEDDTLPDIATRATRGGSEHRLKVEDLINQHLDDGRRYGIDGMHYGRWNTLAQLCEDITKQPSTEADQVPGIRSEDLKRVFKELQKGMADLDRVNEKQEIRWNRLQRCKNTCFSQSWPLFGGLYVETVKIFLAVEHLEQNMARNFTPIDRPLQYYPTTANPSGGVQAGVTENHPRSGTSSSGGGGSSSSSRGAGPFSSGSGASSSSGGGSSSLGGDDVTTDCPNEGAVEDGEVGARTPLIRGAGKVGETPRSPLGERPPMTPINQSVPVDEAWLNQRALDQSHGIIRAPHPQTTILAHVVMAPLDGLGIEKVKKWLAAISFHPDHMEPAWVQSWIRPDQQRDLDSFGRMAPVWKDWRKLNKGELVKLMEKQIVFKTDIVVNSMEELFDGQFFVLTELKIQTLVTSPLMTKLYDKIREYQAAITEWEENPKDWKRLLAIANDLVTKGYSKIKTIGGTWGQGGYKPPEEVRINVEQTSEVRQSILLHLREKTDPLCPSPLKTFMHVIDAAIIWAEHIGKSYRANNKLFAQLSKLPGKVLGGEKSGQGVGTKRDHSKTDEENKFKKFKGGAEERVKCETCGKLHAGVCRYKNKEAGKSSSSSASLGQKMSDHEREKAKNRGKVINSQQGQINALRKLLTLPVIQEALEGTDLEAEGLGEEVQAELRRVKEKTPSSSSSSSSPSRGQGGPKKDDQPKYGDGGAKKKKPDNNKKG